MAKISGIGYGVSGFGNPSTFHYLSSHPLQQITDGQDGIGYWVGLMECWKNRNISIN